MIRANQSPRRTGPDNRPVTTLLLSLAAMFVPISGAVAQTAPLLDIGLSEVRVLTDTVYLNDKAVIEVDAEHLGSEELDDLQIIVDLLVQRSGVRAASTGASVANIEDFVTGDLQTLRVELPELGPGDYDLRATLRLGAVGYGRDEDARNDTLWSHLSVVDSRRPGTSADLIVLGYEIEDIGNAHRLRVDVDNTGVDPLSYNVDIELEAKLTSPVRDVFLQRQLLLPAGDVMPVGDARQLVFDLVDGETGGAVAGWRIPSADVGDEFPLHLLRRARQAQQRRHRRTRRR